MRGCIKIHSELVNNILQPEITEIMNIEKYFLDGNYPELCLSYIRESIWKSEPINRVFRLLCLYVIKNNVPNDLFDEFRRDVIQTYGYKYMFVFSKLSQLGLFKYSDKYITMFDIIQKELGPNTKNILIMFVCGVTYEELTLCRKLNNENRKLVFATDKVINGNLLMESLYEL